MAVRPPWPWSPGSGPRLLLGLSSGTSADALDLVLLQVEGHPYPERIAPLAGDMVAMPAELQTQVRTASEATLEQLAALQFALGRWMGRTAADFLQREGIQPQDLFAAGSHGQTIFHHDGVPAGGTLQWGDPAVLAAALGCPVVADFRWSDLAAGGQGAPLSPLADWLCFRSATASVAVLNLGGIANLSLIQGQRPPRAWDCGPANGPMDELCRRRGLGPFDQDGRLAASGQVQEELLRALKKDPFFSRKLPRSTGLERFGAPLLDRIDNLAPDLTVADQLATLVELAAWAVADSLERANWSEGPVYLAGGGARNPTLRKALVTALGESRPLRPFAESGWDPDLREAMAFALLADAFLLGQPASWPETTGVSAPAILGRWTPPPIS
ncbi:MAG: anhydro-N-acetylmuramic acid kinase [Planctomycetota bacterium]|nr:MAG: anhydro-N-acetylmuramic acid kinase [Planctomycetota bacterium]